MKANELLQIFELGKTFAKVEKPKRRKKKDYDLDEVSITMALHKRLEEAEALKKLLDDYHKAHKKDDPKKEGWSIPHIAMILVMTFPITAPLYVAYVKTLLH